MGDLAVVVGAGAVGLATAWRLTEQGWRVVVVYSKPGEECVSVGAGAIWEFPPFSVEPQALARPWLFASLHVFEQLVKTPESGVVIRPVEYYYRASKCKIHDGAETLSGFGHWNGYPEKEGVVLPGSVPNKPTGIGELYNSGWWYNAPVIHMRTYLGWMKARLQDQGVQFVKHSVSDLRHPLPFKTTLPIRLVVNCAGVYGASLCGDDKSYPNRGAMVFVKCPAIQSVITDDDLTQRELCYIVPQREGVVALAGCAERDNPSETVDEAEQKILIARCEALAPILKGSPVVGTWAGHRPSRTGGIHLVLDEQFGDLKVIHNYGHGGSGVVVSWGCADSVVMLATSSRSRL